MNVIAMAVFYVLLQQSANVQQTPKSTIEGFVVRVGTNEPISRARVTVIRTAGPGAAPIQPGQTIIPAVTTDSQGRFLVKDLEPGSYRLFAARNGFARQEDGERAPGRPGTLLNLVSGQSLRDVVFRLTPGGAVTGRVSDAQGEALAGINVQLVRSVYDPTARRTFQPVSTARTNDRGEYRLYWITPGRYYLSASISRSPGDFGVTIPNTNEVIDPTYATTYYPGTTDASRAALIDVQPGTELSAIDFMMAQQETFVIRGRVIDGSTGLPPRNASVMMMPRRPPLGMILGAAGSNYNPAAGTFELRDVPPGSYWIRAMLLPVSSPTQMLAIQVPIEVSGSNIENLILTVTRGVTIPGRLTVENLPSVSGLQAADNLRVMLQPANNEFMFMGSPPPVVRPDGTFAIENVSTGEYRLVLSPMPPNAYLKSARFGNTDVLQEGLSVSGNLSGELEIVVSPNAAQLEGTVLDREQKPVRGVQVVLIPDRFRERRDLYKTSTTDQNGRFTLRGLTPGDYKLFAWEEIEPFSYYDPDVLRRYEEQGNAVKISESAKTAIEAKMIPVGQ